MKKILTLSLLVATSLFAVTDEQILKLFGAAKQQGLQVKIVSKSQIKDANFEQIVVEITDGKNTQKEVLFSDGKYIFPDVIDADKMVSYGGQFKAAQEKITMKDSYEKLGGLVKKLDKSQIITLGNDKSKPTRYLFTDPECPYCRLELQNIEKDLEKSNIKVIFAPIPSHGDIAIRKSIAILNDVKGVKDDSTKIKILRKYYAEDAKDPTISDDKVKKEKEEVMKIFETGAIRGVPAFIDASDLL